MRAIRVVIGQMNCHERLRDAARRGRHRSLLFRTLRAEEGHLRAQVLIDALDLWRR